MGKGVFCFGVKQIVHGKVIVHIHLFLSPDVSTVPKVSFFSQVQLCDHVGEMPS